jgi:hypothetical protein
MIRVEYTIKPSSWIEESFRIRTVSKEFYSFKQLKAGKHVIVHPCVKDFPLVEAYCYDPKRKRVVGIMISTESGDRIVKLEEISKFKETIGLPDDVKLLLLFVPLPEKVKTSRIIVTFEYEADISDSSKENIEAESDTKESKDAKGKFKITQMEKDLKKRHLLTSFQILDIVGMKYLRRKYSLD